MPDMPTALAKPPHGAEAQSHPMRMARNFYHHDRRSRDLAVALSRAGLPGGDDAPHFERLGALSPATASTILPLWPDKHPPVLHAARRFVGAANED